MAPVLPQPKEPDKALGSVRRAREAIEERHRLGDPSIIPSPTSPTSPTPFIQPGALRGVRTVNPNTTPQPSRSSPPMSSSSRGGLGAIGSAISKPSALSQWPLTEESDGAQSSTASMIDDSDVAGQGPRQYDQYPKFYPNQHQREQHYWEDDFQQAPSSNGRSRANVSSTTTSRTSSSMGIIPEFPSAPPGQAARRAPSYGPPSSRRGGSSYYSGLSNVTSIPEEHFDAGAPPGSLASGRVGTSWGSSNVMGPYFGGDLDRVDGDNDSEQDRSPIGVGEQDERPLVREASVTKRQRPSLTMIGSSDSKRLSNSDKSDKSDPRGTLAVPTPTSTPTKKPSVVANTLSAAAAVAGGPEHPQPAYIKPLTYKPLGAHDQDSQAHAIKASLQRATSPELAGSQPSHSSLSAHFAAPKGSLSTSHRSARPARLDLDTSSSTPRTTTTFQTPGAETRASVTSLPGLIRRATLLATSLDRGNRPGSRFDPLTLTGPDKTFKYYEHGHKSSMTDMLDSFPLTPGLTNSDRGPSPLNNPRSHRFPRLSRTSNRFRNTRWPAEKGQDSSSFTSDTTAGHRPRRRCCGIPLKIFIILLIILALIIAAAIVIPVTLVVLPRRHAQTNPQTSSDCGKTLPCSNGGASILTANSKCSCICVAGFTGPTCQVPGASGCTTTRTESGPDASVGSSIPDLVQKASTKFMIPLNATTLYAKFATEKLDCLGENSLVTLNGQLSGGGGHDGNRTRRAIEEVFNVVVKRQSFATITTNGIVVALSPTTPIVGNASPTPLTVSALPSSILSSGNPTTTFGAASPSSTAPTSSLPIALDSTSWNFARVCVLYIFVASGQDKALAARDKMQDYLAKDTVSRKVDVGNKIIVDFGMLSLDMGDGKGAIGGAKGGTSSV
ncbi:MAG: hypothetical protein M1814_006002 [Vezdaea aestivalis]|nr:MAG: hypothetical protein M1814_006002 [Vezdaea aestivalis]